MATVRLPENTFPASLRYKFSPESTRRHMPVAYRTLSRRKGAEVFRSHEESVTAYQRCCGFSVSLDYLVCSRQHIGRNCQADLLRCLRVDYQLERCWLFNGKVGRLGTLENLIHVTSGAPVQGGKLTP